MQIFTIPHPNTWTELANHLRQTAIDRPLTGRDSDNYSKSEEEAIQKAVAAEEKTAEKAEDTESNPHSAIAIINQAEIYSITLTMEPDPECFHLSIAEQVMFLGMQKANDFVCTVLKTAITTAVEWEERVEGAIPAVRHFYTK